MAEHNESLWVAFTQYTTGGRTWNVTIREGVDPDAIFDMLNQIAEATNRIAEVQDPVRPEPSGTPQGTGGSRNSGGGVFGAQNAPHGPSGASGKGAGPQVSEVSKVVIAGTREAPQVQMFSPNEKLKFPLFTVPSSRVRGILQDRYPNLGEEDLRVFGECGFQFPVDWSVHWSPSPKNEKWKDIITIIQANLE
jgi:hypothetical protein